jgi:hypothetical protein
MTYQTPTAEFDLFVDGEWRAGFEAESRADARRMAVEEFPQINTIRYQGRTELRVHEHECSPGAMAYICCFCQAQLPSDR